MEKSITLKPADLNINLLEGLRKFLEAEKASEITITFKTPNETPRLRVETQAETNQRIDDGIRYFEEGNEGIIFSFDEFNELTNALINMK